MARLMSCLADAATRNSIRSRLSSRPASFLSRVEVPRVEVPSVEMRRVEVAMIFSEGPKKYGKTPCVAIENTGCGAFAALPAPRANAGASRLGNRTWRRLGANRRRLFGYAPPGAEGP